ncbi:MAG: ATP-dependent helicase UvrD/PcrA [Patescibacteria group bacterium]|nr:ATP-dependent helicase UvrD/PcrA [Patescibacteria group bacterium]
MNLFDGLNSAQIEAVQTTSGPLLILAGAGSGKTKTLTHRIAYLISHEVIFPNEILAVTFTNKAAREMRDRLGVLLDQNSNNRNFMPWMGTFHGICVRMLRLDGEAIGISKNFVIYDEDDRQGLIKQAMKQLSISDGEIKAKAASGIISSSKNEMVSPEDYESIAQLPYQKNISKIYKKYEELRKAAKALDFDDLLLETVRLLKDKSEIRKKWQKNFKHILIDEYQDTNAAQYTIVKLLVNDQHNICVVGDDWQCLVKGSLVETPVGLKKIETIEKGDMVRSASGYGSTGYFKVLDRKEFNFKEETITIKTVSGRSITSTPNHLFFAKWDKTTDLFVCLMYSRVKGYRISILKGTEFDGMKLKVQAKQEQADRTWVLKVCSDRQEAMYYEALFSYKYGIPMTPFNTSSNLTSHLSQSYIDTLYKSVDTKERAESLMGDFKIMFDYPHFFSQATTRDCLKHVNLNVVLFGDKRITTANLWSASKLSINTTDSKDMTIFENLGYSVEPGRAGTLKSEIHNLDYGKIEQALQEIQSVTDSDMLCIQKYGFFTKDDSFLFMSASQIHPGMLLPVLDGDELIPDKVISVTKDDYNDSVYDLDIEKVHNYIADGVAVHNSIYSWRGADFTNILNFERDFKGTKVIKLEQNYRSTGNILDAANNVITKNVQRTDKKLWTATGPGNPVQVHSLYDETEEASMVAERIATQVRTGARKYKDFAILYRTNAQSYTLERAFLRLRVPYKIVGGIRFYDRKEIKDIIAYLRLIYQPQDRMSFSRIANVPTRGVGAMSLEKFLVWQSESDMDILTALKNVDQTSTITTRAKLALFDLGEKLQEVHSMVETSSPTELIEKILLLTKYRDFIMDGTPQAEERDANIGSLLSDSQSFLSLPEFLEEVALMSSADVSNDDEKVTLMTLHAAKGLEFPVVFIVGVEEGILPHARVYEAGLAELEEERRLVYVGMTRACEELYMTCAENRLQFGQRGCNPISRFIADMGDQITMFSSVSQFQTVHKQEFFSDELFSVGENVRSSAFGTGQIIEVDGLAVTIKFDDGCTKKLNAEYAHLEKI